MIKNQHNRVNLSMKQGERKPRVRMVPILSLRTLLVVGIGLIVGVGLGLSYWLMSPSLSFLNSEGDGSGGLGGFFNRTESTEDVPWSSKVYIQVLNPGNSSASLRELQEQGVYYASKVNSWPFLEFLSQELVEQATKYSHTADELDQMIRIRYEPNEQDFRFPGADQESENPAIEVKVTATTSQEALFFAEFLPKAFNNYLISIEDYKLEEEYQNTLKEIETVKAALYEAEQELDTLKSEDILNNPDYIFLNARIDALERQLEDQALEPTTLITLDGDLEQEYADILRQMEDVSTALAEAEQELKAMEGQETGSVDFRSEAVDLTLNAKITALELELNKLMTGWIETTATSTERHIGLAEMIANGDTNDTFYKQRLEEVERVSAALAEAEEERDKFNRNSGGNPPSGRDYLLTQIRVDTLNATLSALKERLAVLTQVKLAGENQADTQVTFKRTALLLSKVKGELAALEKELGYDRVKAGLDYKATQERIDNLNARLKELTEKLSTLVGETVKSSELTGYLAAGKPSMPTPELPARMRARNALMMGAIVGIGGAWVILNFRWIAKGMPSSGTAAPEDEDEEE